MCRICGNIDGNRIVSAREMMFGFRDRFNYLECCSCGCLGIIDPPASLDRYYPKEYFPSVTARSKGGIKAYLRRQRARHCLNRSSLIGAPLTVIFGRPTCDIFGKPDYYGWLSKCALKFDSRILDVGCGMGVLLTQLMKDGFTNLHGIDPYIEHDISIPPYLSIRKAEISTTEGTYDFVMLHHTFEHIRDPLETLLRINSILNHGSFLLIRIPVASSYAYRTYGVNWAQLDAPRHYFLHTVKSMEILANQAGFNLSDIEFDSTEFQFWASEQYKCDIPLHDPASGPDQLSLETRKSYRQKARDLNQRREGDSAAFYLYKP